MKRKVLIWEALNFLGGGQKLALEVADAIRGDFAVEMLLPGPGKFADALAQKGIPYMFFFQNRFSRGKKGWRDILKLILLAPWVLASSLRCIARAKPQLIYSNGAPTFINAAVIGAMLKIPVVWHVHNYFADGKTVWLLNFFGRLSSVKLVICESKALEVQFRRLQQKVISICPGIDVDEFRASRSNPDVRRKLGIDGQKHIVVQMGWVIRSKGQHLLIEAARYVVERRKDVVFLIVGQNLPGQEDYLEELKQRIADYGLEDSVRIVGFWDDIKSLFNEAFVNVITSFEGFSLVMLEAAALNLPTIGPDVGGPGVVIEDGHSGLIYRFGDTTDLAEKILSLLSDGERYQAIRQHNAHFVAKYTVAQYHRNIRSAVGKLFVGGQAEL